MGQAMAEQFERNEWRERQPFPSADDLFLRAVRSLTDARRCMQASDRDGATRHVADAANLMGLAVVFGE